MQTSDEAIQNFDENSSWAADRSRIVKAAAPNSSVSHAHFTLSNYGTNTPLHTPKRRRFVQPATSSALSPTPTLDSHTHVLSPTQPSESPDAVTSYNPTEASHASPGYVVNQASGLYGDHRQLSPLPGPRPTVAVAISRPTHFSAAQHPSSGLNNQPHLLNSGPPAMGAPPINGTSAVNVGTASGYGTAYTNATSIVNTSGAIDSAGYPPSVAPSSSFPSLPSSGSSRGPGPIPSGYGSFGGLSSVTPRTVSIGNMSGSGGAWSYGSTSGVSGDGSVSVGGTGMSGAFTPGANSGTRFYVALGEFRNRQQVGMAAIDLHSPHVYLCQYSDNNMYANTLMMLNYYDPAAILLSDTTSDTLLYKLITKEYQAAHVHKIKRKFFSEKAGLDLLDRYCMPQDVAASRLDDDKYLCLTAAGCLLRYISYDQKLFTFAPASLRLSYTNTRGSMQVDVHTVQALELVRNTNSLTTAQVAGKRGRTRQSLFEVLNHTKTKSGARLLRMSLLQPPIDEDTIRIRQNSVAELLQNEFLFQRLSALLPLFDELSSLCATFARVPLKDTVHTITQQISALLSLRTILSHLPELARACASVGQQQQQQQQSGQSEQPRGSHAPRNDRSSSSSSSSSSAAAGLSSIDEAALPHSHAHQHVHDPSSLPPLSADSSLFPSLGLSLQSPAAAELLARLDSMLNIEACSGGRGLEQARIQVVYAVKSGASGLLDVARETFAGAIEELSRVSQATFTALDLPHGRLAYSATRGYHLTLPAAALPRDLHTDVLVKRVYSGSRVWCTTAEVESLELRQRDSFAEACEQARMVLDSLLNTVRSHLSWLHSIAEAVALLDLVLCFAHHAAAQQGYVRPQVAMHAAIAIKAGRHPLLDNAHARTHSGSGGSGGEYVANDIYLNSFSNTLLVSGPNNSGKSTYMKQTALLVLLAHTGSFIPAAAAEVRVIKHLYVCAQEDSTHRVSVGVGVQNSTSAFFTEMKRIAAVLNRYAPDTDAVARGYRGGNGDGREGLGEGRSKHDEEEEMYKYRSGGRGSRNRDDDRDAGAGSEGDDASHALILLDELGRSTSSEDGACVAWAVLERLAIAQCLCVCVTHLVQLAAMPHVYPNVRNVSLEVHWQSSTPASGSAGNAVMATSGSTSGAVGPGMASGSVPLLRFPFRVRAGVGSVYAQAYGIAVAAAVGMPPALVRDAEEVARALRAGDAVLQGGTGKAGEGPDGSEAGDGGRSNASVSARAAAMHTLLGRVLCLRHRGGGDVRQVRTILMEVVRAFAEEVASAKA